MGQGTVLSNFMDGIGSDPFRRNLCAICSVNKHHHLNALGHSFVPGDWPIYQLLPGDLQPGDIVAESGNAATIVISVYRRP